jgi:hypothetical protein
VPADIVLRITDFARAVAGLDGILSRAKNDYAIWAVVISTARTVEDMGPGVAVIDESIAGQGRQAGESQ